MSVKKLFDLSGRGAIVTGGSRGIGLALAQGFAARRFKARIAREDQFDVVARRRQQLAVGDDVGDLELGQTALPGSEHFAAAA